MCFNAAKCKVIHLRTEDRLNNSCVSHNEPILCCQYNKPFQQVVSCSEGSAIKVWDLQNGQLVTEIYEAHGDAAVTCMTLEPSGKRLVTGGRDGSLKKWDCSTIRYIHTLKQAATSSDQVTACMYADIYSNRYIISVGWDRKINIFPDLPSEASDGPCPQLDWTESVVLFQFFFPLPPPRGFNHQQSCISPIKIRKEENSSFVSVQWTQR
ncbi:cilia- and flagella-associated protein 337-like [Emydura macquarii macquarii]|uniref:cilia- and flagella-associated protein 337-like n=1 Tax=Emydura macquarii macquarii TaxID=1129001 RepID=UPI00352B528E